MLVCAVIACDAPPPSIEWREYASDLSSSKYAPIDQITAENVGQLEVAWRWTSPDEAIRTARPELWTFTTESSYIAIPVGGASLTVELVALRLPAGR